MLPPPPPLPAPCASVHALRLLVLLDFDFGFGFFFWFAIWFVWHLVQISFICGFGVNVPQQMHFWYAYISVCQCVWGCVCECVCLSVSRYELWLVLYWFYQTLTLRRAAVASSLHFDFSHAINFTDWHDNCQLSHDKWQWRQLEYDTHRLVQRMSRM